LIYKGFDSKRNGKKMVKNTMNWVDFCKYNIVYCALYTFHIL